MNPAATSWAFEAQDLERLDALLGAFLDGSQARCALLLDRTGRLLTAAGDDAGFDRVSFASLAAADFGASDQLARLLGEREFRSLYHQGENGSMYLVDIAGHAILAALFDARTTLGRVRLKTKAVVPEFASLFAQIAARDRTVGARLEAGWLTEVEDEIDRLFAE